MGAGKMNQNPALWFMVKRLRRIRILSGFMAKLFNPPPTGALPFFDLHSPALQGMSQWSPTEHDRATFELLSRGFIASGTPCRTLAMLLVMASVT
jgi:hypothetical protein